MQFAQTVYIPAKVKKDTWLRFDISNNTSFEILVAINRVRPASFYIEEENLLHVTADQADIEGFNNEENTLKVQKTFDGPAYVTIISLTPKGDSNLQNNDIGKFQRYVVKKQDYITYTKVTITAHEPKSEIKCIEICQNGFSCKSISVGCDCQNSENFDEKRLLKKKISHKFYYGRDCSKSLLFHDTNIFNKKLLLKPLDTSVIVIHNSDLKAKLHLETFVTSVSIEPVTYFNTDADRLDPNFFNKKNTFIRNKYVKNVKYQLNYGTYYYFRKESREQPYFFFFVHSLLHDVSTEFVVNITIRDWWFVNEAFVNC